ncbi:MAG: flagellar assembly protein FliW [Oligoflexales bacterium]
MAKVKTTRFGEIEVKDKDIVQLPNGLIGFPELKQYVILDHDDKSPFKWLQSLDDGSIAFVLINPLLFKPDYTVEVNEAEVADLEIKDEKDAVISVIVTMPSNPQNMTANLKAPLVFNLKNRKGRQIILNNQEYTTRHNILEEVKKRANEVDSQVIQEVIEKAKDAVATETETKEAKKK